MSGRCFENNTAITDRFFNPSNYNNRLLYKKW